MPSTSANPSRAALPVSPEVATKITTLCFSPVLAIALVRTWGKSCKAISLKAEVGPCHNSKTEVLAFTLTRGAGSPPNFSGA